MTLALGLAAVAAGAAEFKVAPGGKNQIVFLSKAPIESFEGRTRHIEGRIVVDPAGVSDSVTVHLEVDLASLDTGIARRNQHMRDNHLETKKYPRAVFDGASVSAPTGAKLEPGKPATFTVEGTFSLHGVRRRLRINAEVTYTPSPAGGQIEFRTSFPVNLPDYSIRRPEFLFLKLAETQEVKVYGVGSASKN